MERSSGYDPAVTWEIFDIRPTAFSGVADVFLSINKRPPIHIFYSAETQLAIAGEMIPFGPNPFEAARAKLRAADGPSRGADKPVVTLVVFSELECPHCKAAEPVLASLEKDFPQIRIVFQPYPLQPSLHPWAMQAAKFADCVGRQNRDAFWRFSDAVFEHQSEINAANAEATLKELAAKAGADPERAASCSADAETGTRVQSSIALGNSLDVNQVPTAFLNGRRVLDLASIPYSDLKRLVQFEIDHAGQ